ncbi:hypothetical protein, partial [Vibrio kanaloae]|uniref:hypothetical protein n=1 Tax=Vibrio kanaloae TaxID=170673 RepID=UPI0019D0E8E4
FNDHGYIAYCLLTLSMAIFVCVAQSLIVMIRFIRESANELINDSNGGFISDSNNRFTNEQNDRMTR